MWECISVILFSFPEEHPFFKALIGSNYITQSPCTFPSVENCTDTKYFGKSVSNIAKSSVYTSEVQAQKVIARSVGFLLASGMRLRKGIPSP